MCIFPVNLDGKCQFCGESNAQCKTKFAYESSYCCKQCEHFYEGRLEIVHYDSVN